MTEIKLKHCPFCGRDAILRENNAPEETRYYILCGKCGCKTHMFIMQNEAIAAWNRRFKKYIKQ